MTLTTRASASLDERREQFDWVRPGHTAVVADDSGLTWWTFGGLHANAGIMAAMGPMLGGSKVDNLAIKLDPDRADAASVRELARRIARCDAESMPQPSIAEELATKLKFADCLPETVALGIAAARVSDPEGIAGVVNEPVDIAYATQGS